MNYYNRNKITFGLGTIGRDMTYTIVSMYLMFYLTDIMFVGSMPGNVLVWITAIMTIGRVFDAVNDPVMGTITDNTKTRWGKYKPWIAIGALLSGLLTILLFTDFGLSGISYAVMFGIVYLLWDIAFTMNDIPFWSMMANLTDDQRKREEIGAFARICANIGLFFVAGGIEPITRALGVAFGTAEEPNMKAAYFVFTLIIVAILWIGQLVTLFGVKEPKSLYRSEQTTIKQMFNALFKNDQLLWTAISMVLFMIGYVTTTSFGQYFFRYDFGDDSMYAIFTVVLGISQISALIAFPFFSKKFTRRKLFSGCMGLVAAGYFVFLLTGYILPMNMIFIGIAGVLLFVGQAGIQLLMLVFLADTVEYGQWKLGQRNEAVTFSVQPFINKMGAAVGTGLVGLVMIMTSIGTAASRYVPGGNYRDLVSDGERFLMRVFMLIIPLICMTASYIIYMKKYKIDKAFYEKVVSELKEREGMEANKNEDT